MKFGVVVFPGSNCERDMADAVRLYLKEDVVYLWHDEANLPSGLDAILLPGGFSYGDYLRSGALARFSPVMSAVRAFADKGGSVLGVCNGFQILTEAGLLPGALMRNTSLKFQCKPVALTVENNKTLFSSTYSAGQIIQLPIAHADGNYYTDNETLQRLEDNHQVVLRYQEDVNGSLNRIAGICNDRGNVVGMMPHPERNLWPDSSETAAGNWSGDGCGVFDSVLKSLASRV